MLLFFVLAGASFETELMVEAGVVCIAYIALRAGARVIGGWAGGRFARLPARESGLTGLALMPQAGVALGMALVAVERLPEIGNELLAVTVASTIAFEIGGPLLTQYALSRAQAAKVP